MKIATLLLLLFCSAAGAETYDILIRGGKLYDGTAAPWRYADVGINGDRIVAVGSLEGDQGKRTIDASGLYIAPGFIDPHSHAGGTLEKKDLAGARALVAEGITTVFINPDGGGEADLRAQLETLKAAGPGVNIAPMIGHNAVRREAMGQQAREPTAAELQQMQRRVREGMEVGAFGFSDGPFYAPASFSKTDEIVALAKIAAGYGGFYTSHIRDESDYTIGLMGAVEELITVGREAQLPVIFTHIKALGPNVWGKSADVIKRIDAARAEGIEVWADQYPYTASQTSLSAALIPRWAQEGGREQLMARLGNPAEREKIEREMAENMKRRGGAESLQIGRASKDPSLEGMRLSAVAQKMKLDPIDAAIKLMQDNEGVPIVSFNMSDADVEAFMRQPWTMTCSDGDLAVFGEGAAHPRAYGSFPRKIRLYALEKKTIPLEKAIHAATGLPASVLGLPDRGLIRRGAIADVLVFDMAKLRDTATYEKPHAYAEGMVHVLVNGQAVIDAGTFNDHRAGRILARPVNKE